MFFDYVLVKIVSHQDTVFEVLFLNGVSLSSRSE